VAAPAFAADAEKVAAGEARLRERGYRVVRREDAVARCGYLAGDDARRAAELMAWVDDPAVDAILCARGGYGCHRIMHALDASRVRAAAKPLVGFSDVTTLLLWQRRRAGLVGFHGPVLEHSFADAELDVLLAALSGAPLPTLRGRGHGGGRATGRLLGGSLTLLAASLGTPWEPRVGGAILMIEEVNEKPYALDRMLHHLRAAGKLEGLAGVGVGRLVGCTDPKRPTPEALTVVSEILGALGVPLVTGLPFGHGVPNLTWPVGVRASLDGERGELRILEAGVTRR
jgi:muramoyltetrapeptide carboxypeptidase